MFNSYFDITRGYPIKFDGLSDLSDQSWPCPDLSCRPLHLPQVVTPSARENWQLIRGHRGSWPLWPRVPVATADSEVERFHLRLSTDSVFLQVERSSVLPRSSKYSQSFEVKGRSSCFVSNQPVPSTMKAPVTAYNSYISVQSQQMVH